MKKILLFVHELTFSGSPNSTLRLARALKALGYNVETWSYVDGPFRREYENNNIKIDIVAKSDLRNHDVIRRCKKFDLLIANSILTSEAVEGLGAIIPTVWYIREAENIPDFFENNHKRGLVIQKCQNLLAVSEYAAEYIKHYFNCNVRVLHNCVDDMYAPYKNHVVKTDKIKIIMIGTIERRKNFILLIDAYLSLPEQYKVKIELHLVGRLIEGERAYYERVVKKSAENEGIFFHGEITDRDEMMHLISEMNVLAVLSRDESCSLTALEGAMMAKPLVLSENVGAKYLVNEDNGWIVKTDDIDDTRKMLIEIYDKRDMLYSMGQNSREKYENTSTFDIYIKNVEEMIKNFRLNKAIYYIKNQKKRMVWHYDDTTKYFRYPEWGDTSSEKHLYSYDIFDTLISRDVATPIGIFALMQEQLYFNPTYAQISEYVKDNFVDLRIGAEGFARQVYCISGLEDKTFDQIYEALYATGRVTSKEIELLKELEISLEMEHCIGIYENIRELKKLVYSGKRVVLISDMYFPQNIIRNMLVKVDSVFAGIPIYVSSEVGKMKGTTHLFKSVQAHEKVSFHNWTHIGDNINADVNSPKSLGIEVKGYSGVALTEFENRIINNREKDYWVQILIGLARKMKLCAEQNELELSSKTIYAIQILYAYVNDIIEFLAQQEYDGIFLVGRFGYLLKGTFKQMFEREKINVIFIPQWILEHRRNFIAPINNLVQVILYELSTDKLTVEEFLELFNISEVEYQKQILLSTQGVFPNDAKEKLQNLLQQPSFIEFIDEKRSHLLSEIASKVDSARYLFVDEYENHYMEMCDFLGVHFPKTAFFSSVEFEIGFERKKDYSFYLKLNSEGKKVCEHIFSYTVEELSKCKPLEEILTQCLQIVEKSHRTTSYKNSTHQIECELIKQAGTVFAKEVEQKKDKYNTYSFGLRETIITYDLASPRGLFLYMKKHIEDKKNKYGFSDKFIDEFISIREEAETKVTNHYNAKRINHKNIEDIYDYIFSFSDISIRAKEHLKRYELFLVRKHIIGIMDNIERIRNLRNRGKKVIIIANTLYPKDFIQKILSNIDPVLGECSLYFPYSEMCYVGRPKVFYEYIKAQEKIEFNRWMHCGNSLYWDVNEPSKLGISVERTLVSQLLPYECAAIKEFENHISVQAKIGTAKCCRLNKVMSKTYTIGNALAGPMLYSYVKWVIDDAVERGTDKLLFVARDGFILKEIADIIVQDEQINISTEYVFGSRKAWRMPSYEEGDSLDIFFKMAHIDQLDTVEAFSRIFKIPYSDFVQYVPFQYRDPKCKLQKQDYILLRNILEENADFKRYLFQKATEERNKIVRYFADICQNQTFAFVELSGTGSTQNCLGKILKDLTVRVIDTYFLNLDGLKHSDNVRFLNYIPNNYHYVWIIENLCRAPHGQTEGYEKIEDKIVPVISKGSEAEALIKHGYLDYIEGIKMFAKAFVRRTDLNCVEMESPIVFSKYLRHIVYNPCQEVLDFIGDMPFESTGFSNDLEVFAPRLTEQQMRQIFLTRGDESIDSYYRGACLDYSLKRMSDEERQKIEHYRHAVATREGQKARNEKRIEEQGRVYALQYLWRRAIRELLLKMGIIKY